MRQARSWIGLLAGAGLGVAWAYLSNPWRRGLHRDRRAPLSTLDKPQRRSIDIATTVYISAPIATVFEFWISPEALRLFMNHRGEASVANAGDRFQWRIAGRPGAPIAFDAVFTRLDPPRVIAWKTVEGSQLVHAGVTCFEAAGADATRVHVQFSYRRPGGEAGEAVDALLGGDPRAGVEAALSRVKTAIETGVSCCDRAR